MLACAPGQPSVSRFCAGWFRWYAGRSHSWATELTEFDEITGGGTNEGRSSDQVFVSYFKIVVEALVSIMLQKVR